LLSATRDRPVFLLTRRPPPPIVAAPSVAPVRALPPPAPEPDHPLLKLVGTIAGQEEGIALFLDEATRAMLRLRIGEGHDGWVLRAISGRDVFFAKGERDATLSLPPRGSSEAPSAVAAVAPKVGGVWTDGDGQAITPPLAPTAPSAAASGGSETWRDGDGRMISPPPMHLASPLMTP
jgi:general secretion pathway protein N